MAITTNEDLAALHPAVVRPGRCLAHLEVGRLTPAEAAAWLNDVVPVGIGPAGATLAELYAIRSLGLGHAHRTHPGDGPVPVAPLRFEYLTSSTRIQLLWVE